MLLQELYTLDDNSPWENFSDRLLVSVEVGAERSFLMLYVCLYQLSTIEIKLLCPLLCPNVRPISVSDLLEPLVSRSVAVFLYFVAAMWYRLYSFLRRFFRC